MSRFAILFTAILVVAVPSAGHARTAQQQRMSDCNAQASNIAGSERQEFMKSCLHAPKKLSCSHGKLCGNACIAANEICRR